MYAYAPSGVPSLASGTKKTKKKKRKKKEKENEEKEEEPQTVEGAWRRDEKGGTEEALGEGNGGVSERSPARGFTYG